MPRRVDHAQSRPRVAPPLRTTAYARAFQEVKEYGAADSTRRTDDQTAYALWWMEFAEGSVGRTHRARGSAVPVHESGGGSAALPQPGRRVSRELQHRCPTNQGLRCRDRAIT